MADLDVQESLSSECTCIDDPRAGPVEALRALNEATVPQRKRQHNCLPRLEATEPPEARGLKRDQVRLLVSNVDDDSIEHAHFYDLPRLLSAGDVLVVNTSGTLSAALPATSISGDAFELHLSTALPGGFWTVEVRQPGAVASLPYKGAQAGARFRLPAGGEATLLAPYPLVDGIGAPSRLWMTALQLPETLPAYLERFGIPIRYQYVTKRWPASMYQTIFATEPGSAEMPSAGRPFTHELVTTLVSRGIQIAPLVLHTGVASLESHEPPYEEFYRVPRDTADRVNAARQAGHRIVAVGTTVVRALETVTDDRRMTFPGQGWTDIVVSPERPVRSVDALITGLHEPQASHLMMLEQVVAAGKRQQDQRLGDEGVDRRAARHLASAYAAARSSGYLWHEFGDSHLLIGTKVISRHR
ncbi:MAG: queuosine biosynthesis protein [Blastocatellia bacterium]|nr:MAG: queuosine biosynthesis protein [Blastocatellia bacterium]